MLRRLVAFLAALLLMALPVAKVVCEAACARDAGAMDSVHTCCHGTQRASGAAFGTVTQLCDHPAENSFTSQSRELSSAPAITTTVVAFIAPRRAGRSDTARDIPRLPNPLVFTTQLRV
jgi:hypothetical protein